LWYLETTLAYSQLLGIFFIPEECHRVPVAVLDNWCPLAGNKYAKCQYFRFEFLGVSLDKLTARAYVNSGTLKSTHL